MNNTNRGLNRLLILLIGLVLIALGASAIAVGAVPSVRSAWRDSVPRARSTVSGWFVAAPVPGISTSWWWIAILATLVLIVVALIVFILRQGHGHTNRLVRDAPTDHGATVIDSRVAEQLMQNALDGHPQLVASHVSTYLVKRAPVLKVSTTARRGVSPREVLEIAESALASLDQLLGRPVLASVQVSGGFRARVTSTTRLH